MRYVLILLLFSLSAAVGQTLTKEDYKKIKSLVPAGCNVKADYVDQVIWVQTNDISLMNQGQKVHKFYFAVKKKSDGSFSIGEIRYKYIYNGQDWLFIDSMLVISAKSNNDSRNGIGTRYMIRASSYDYREVNNNATITEGFDIYGSPVVAQWLSDIAETNNFSRIRIYGKKTYDDQALRGSDLAGQARNIIKARTSLLEQLK